jgi:predicted GNAT family acetyltransferase
MDVRQLEDAAAFLDQARAFLLGAEARNNLILGIAGTLVATPDRYGEKRFWVVVDDGEVVGAAVQTPPYNLVLAGPSSDAAIATLAAGIADDLPGVVGAHPEVDEFVRAWAETRGVGARVVRDQGVYALERVQPVPAVPGTFRRAVEGDLPFLVEWIEAFGLEVLEEGDPGRSGVHAGVAYRLRGEDGGGFALWEDGGEAVSVSGWGAPTPNGIRIGPVYTPPELRGRGYATALVAQLSQSLLDGGRTFCFLFTDLANPTSNAIYERIGYVRVCESAMITFR